MRLACVKRAASVDSEPGSNSRLILLRLRPSPELAGQAIYRLGLLKVLTNITSASNQIVKELRNRPNDPKKTESTTGLESRFGASDTRIRSHHPNRNSWE